MYAIASYMNILTQSIKKSELLNYKVCPFYRSCNNSRYKQW